MAKKLAIWGGQASLTFLVAVLCSLSPTDTPRAQADGATWDAVEHAAATHGVRPTFLHCLADRESGHSPGAVNRGGNFHGTFQYLPSTWAAQSWRYGYGGASVYDGWANAHVAAASIASNRWGWGWLYGQWPPARWCGSPW